VPHHLVLRNPPTPKPLDDWRSVAVELLGTQTRLVQGERFVHRVIECGSGGEPLILIHGIGGHAETWARNLHNLAANGFHVYAIDALYHGYSSRQPRADGFDARTALQADALADLVHALGHGYAHVEGESMGAAIAYEFGIRHPGLAGKLVLNTGFPAVTTSRTDFAQNPGGGPELMKLSQDSVTTRSFQVMRDRMRWLVAKPERMTDEMVDIRLRLYSDPEIRDAMAYVYQIGGEWALPEPVPEAALASFPHETLVFWTEDNPGRGLDYGEHLSTLLPKGSFYGMTDAGHWPQWEKPEEHDQVLIEFVLQ
jgi:pimeloyl-ACP methyl ester carboxylesterase